jgi:hypothetical protein
MSHYVLTIVGETAVAQDIYADAYESQMHTDGSMAIDFVNDDGDIIAEVRVSAYHSVIIKLSS